MTKKNNNENKNNKNADIKQSNNAIKDQVKNAKINFHQKRPSQIPRNIVHRRSRSFKTESQRIT